jgi:hypothetical protein
LTVPKHHSSDKFPENQRFNPVFKTGLLRAPPQKLILKILMNPIFLSRHEILTFSLDLLTILNVMMPLLQQNRGKGDDDCGNPGFDPDRGRCRSGGHGSHDGSGRGDERGGVRLRLQQRKLRYIWLRLRHRGNLWRWL